MKKENLYLIHGEDYLRHIEEKLELLWMATILMHYIKNGAEKDGYLDLVRRSTLDFDERCEEMFSSWGKALNYLKSRDLADLYDLVENELIEPEHAGYVHDTLVDVLRRIEGGVEVVMQVFLGDTDTAGAVGLGVPWLWMRASL